MVFHFRQKLLVQMHPSDLRNGALFRETMPSNPPLYRSGIYWNGESKNYLDDLGLEL